MDFEELKDNIELPEKPDFFEELLSIIKSDLKSSEIKEKLYEYHDNDIAEVIPELTLEARKKLYRIFQTHSFFIIRFLVTKKSEKPLYLLNIWAVFRGLLHFAMKNPFSFKCYL